MQNYYPNPPTPQDPQFAYDRNGNVVGVIQQQSQTTQNRMPDWWPRTQQQSPPQQQNRPAAIQGKWIGSPNDVVPMDVPQNGSIAIFPQEDLNVIFVKKWESNGTITTIPYIPNIQQEPQGPTPEQQFQASVQQRLSNMEQILVNLVNMWQTPTAENKEELA